jgi:hypothetical protein
MRSAGYLARQWRAALAVLGEERSAEPMVWVSAVSQALDGLAF